MSRFYIVITGVDWDGEAAGFTLILNADQLPSACHRVEKDWMLAVAVLLGWLYRYGTLPEPPLEAISRVEVVKVTAAGRRTTRSLDIDPPHRPYASTREKEKRLEEMGDPIYAKAAELRALGVLA